MRTSRPISEICTYRSGLELDVVYLQHYQGLAISVAKRFNHHRTKRLSASVKL